MSSEFIERNYLGEKYYYNERTNKWFDHSFCAAPISVIYALGGKVITHTRNAGYARHSRGVGFSYYCSTDALDFRLPGCYGMGKNR